MSHVVTIDIHGKSFTRDAIVPTLKGIYSGKSEYLKQFPTLGRKASLYIEVAYSTKEKRNKKTNEVIQKSEYTHYFYVLDNSDLKKLFKQFKSDWWWEFSEQYHKKSKHFYYKDVLKNTDTTAEMLKTIRKMVMCLPARKDENDDRIVKEFGIDKFFHSFEATKFDAPFVEVKRKDAEDTERTAKVQFDGKLFTAEELLEAFKVSIDKVQTHKDFDKIDWTR